MTKNITLSLLALLTATPSISYTSEIPLWMKISAAGGVLTTLAVLGVNLSVKNAQLQKDLEIAKNQVTRAQVQRMELATLVVGVLTKNNEKPQDTIDRLKPMLQKHKQTTARDSNSYPDVVDNLSGALGYLSTQGAPNFNSDNDPRKQMWILNMAKQIKNQENQ